MMSSDLDYGAERWPSDDWWVRLLDREMGMSYRRNKLHKARKAKAPDQLRRMWPEIYNPADRVMLVGCPRCGAEPLARCNPPSGQLVHHARVQAWEQAGKPTERDQGLHVHREITGRSRPRTACAAPLGPAKYGANCEQ